MTYMKPWDKMDNDEKTEIRVIAEKMFCSIETAQYINGLENRLHRIEQRLKELWDDYQQR